MLRRILIVLVFSLPLLVVSFAVLMGGYALVEATGDQTAALVLFWVAMSCLVVLAINLVLLAGVLGVYVLGVRALVGFDEERDGSEE